MMPKKLFLPLLLVALPLSPAFAGSAGPTATAMQGMSMGVAAMSMQLRQRMRPVMAQLEPLSGIAFDRAFLSAMIPHHQSSIEMSRAVLPRLRDPLVREWARDIIDEQQQEIAQMQAELRTLGGANARLQTLARQSTAGMTEMMRAAQNPDRTFLEMMTPHHGGGNDMATLEFEQGEDKQVLNLAQRILTSQADQMHDFRDWLRSRP